MGHRQLDANDQHQRCTCEDELFGGKARAGLLHRCLQPISRSMEILTGWPPRGFTLVTLPTRSPDCGSASPLLEMRASICTSSALERLRPGTIAFASLSVKVTGQCCARMRRTASGGPGAFGCLA